MISLLKLVFPVKLPSPHWVWKECHCSGTGPVIYVCVMMRLANVGGTAPSGTGNSIADDREPMLLGDPLKILFRQPRLAGKHVTLHGCARQKSRGTGDDGLPADHLARYVDAVAFKTAFAISRPIVVLVCITGSESWEP